jgi:two-component system, sensor histidine kinase
LISNAFKFTQKGSVSLKFEKDLNTLEANEYLIKVRDTGIGISEENQKLLFQEFGKIILKKN